MATCSFVSFPLPSSTGICLIDSFDGEVAIVSGPCSCTTKKDFNALGAGVTYKIEAYLNSVSAKIVFDNITVGLKADACGVCGGDSASCAGCDGVPNSGKVFDRCIVCGGNNACVGCDDIPFSGKKYDACGVCGGNNATCAGCDGVPNSGKVYDQCGICGGDGQLCILDYKLTASRNSFCDGLDLVVRWVAPINHTGFDSVVFFSKTNNSVIDQCVAAAAAALAVCYWIWLLRALWLCDGHALSSDIFFLGFSIKAILFCPLQKNPLTLPFTFRPVGPTFCKLPYVALRSASTYE
jgi:hypothetical protein